MYMSGINCEIALHYFHGELCCHFAVLKSYVFYIRLPSTTGIAWVYYIAREIHKNIIWIYLACT
jgi:hypothetical protein